MFIRLFPLCIMFSLLLACDGGHDVVVLSQSDSPDNSTDEEPAGSEVALHQHGAVGYSTVNAGIWPPQPVGVDNIQPFSNSDLQDIPREIKLVDALTVALQEPTVLSAIGSRYEIVGRYEAHHKDARPLQSEIEIFNYENNKLITVGLNTANQVTVSTQHAHEYQPAESDNERMRAVELAAVHLSELGYRTEHLIGTALLAHPTAAEFAANGQYFYDQRIVYVTFGKGSGSTPLYRANVNLSRESVNKAGPL